MSAIVIYENDGSVSYAIGPTPPAAPLPIDFPWYFADEIAVTHWPTPLTGFALVPNIDYTLAGVPADDGFWSGSITMIKVVTNCTIRIDRTLRATKATNFPEAGAISIPAMNTLFSRLFSWVQDLARQLGRVVEGAPGTPDGGVYLPLAGGTITGALKQAMSHPVFVWQDLGGIADQRTWTMKVNPTNGNINWSPADDLEVAQGTISFRRDGGIYCAKYLGGTFGGSWLSLADVATGIDFTASGAPANKQNWQFVAGTNGSFELQSMADDWVTEHAAWSFNTAGSLHILLPTITPNSATEFATYVGNQYFSSLGQYLDSGWHGDLSLTSISNAGYGSGANFNMARGSIGAPAAVQIGDLLGWTAAFGHDGSTYTQVGELHWMVDGVPSSGVVPASFTLVMMATPTGNWPVLSSHSNGRLDLGKGAPLFVDIDATVHAPTPGSSDASTKVATTAFVKSLLAIRGQGDAIYAYGGSAVAVPTSGHFNLNVGSGTLRHFTMSTTDADGIGRYLKLLQAGDSMVITSENAPISAYSRYDLISAVTDHTSWVEFDAHWIDSAGFSEAPAVESRWKFTGYLNLATGDGPILGIETLASSGLLGGASTGVPSLSINPAIVASQTDLAAATASKAPLVSPTFTGDPKAPTPAASDSDTSIATTAFVKTAGATAQFYTINLDPEWWLHINVIDTVLSTAPIGNAGEKWLVFGAFSIYHTDATGIAPSYFDVSLYQAATEIGHCTLVCPMPNHSMFNTIHALVTLAGPTVFNLGVKALGIANGRVNGFPNGPTKITAIRMG
jgi:hypothetical protein